MAGQSQPAHQAASQAASQTVRALRYLAASRLARLHDQVWASLSAWGEDWGIVGPDSLTLDCTRAWERPELAAQPWHTGAAGIWFAGSSGLARQLALIWWGGEAQRGNLAEASSTSAALDLTERLSSLADGGKAQAGTAADCFAHASGAVVLHIGLVNTTLQVLLAEPDSLLGAPLVPPALPKPVPVHHGLGKQPVSVQVEVGQSVVSLSALMTLAVGDVIRLESPIDQPARLLTNKGVALFAGYLGKIDDNVAVELTPLSNKKTS